MGGQRSSKGEPSGAGNGDAFSYFDTPDGAVDPAAGGESIKNVDDYASYEIADGLFFRPVFAENMALNFVTFPPHSGFPEHTHPEEQISIVVAGEMEITVGGLRRMVRPGDVVIYPANVTHSGTTLDEGCRLIDIFSPPRAGIRDVIAAADPAREADADRWWFRPHQP